MNAGMATPGAHGTTSANTSTCLAATSKSEAIQCILSTSQGRPLNQQQQLHNPNRTASSISVTTGCRGGPYSVSSIGFAALSQQQHGLQRTTMAGVVTFRGGGITLPKERPYESRSTKQGLCSIASHQTRKVVTIISAPQTNPGKPATTTASPCDVVVGNNTDKTKVYSAACRASVDAHQLAFKRSASSAPGLRVLSDLGSDRVKHKYKKVVGGQPTYVANSRRMSLIVENEISPQVFLDTMLKSRGYSTRTFCSLEGAYYCKPTALQKASYGINLIAAIRQSNELLLQKMLEVGISPNPCNDFGESAVHMMCRRGDYKLVKLFKDHGCSFQVTDDFGRTPLHDACWTSDPPFQIVDMILTADRRLLHLVDCRGSSPLSYVSRHNWAKWISFFQSRADTYWPPRNVANEGDEIPPPFCWEAQHSRPIPDPPHAMSVEAAQKLVSLGNGDPGGPPLGA